MSHIDSIFIKENKVSSFGKGSLALAITLQAVSIAALAVFGNALGTHFSLWQPHLLTWRNWMIAPACGAVGFIVMMSIFERALYKRYQESNKQNPLSIPAASSNLAKMVASSKQVKVNSLEKDAKQVFENRAFRKDPYLTRNIMLEHLHQDPSFYLEEFVEHVDKYNTPIWINFFDTNKEQMKGHDNGGLSRCYINAILPGSATQHNNWFVGELGDLTPVVPESDAAKARLFYEKIGKALAFCYLYNKKLDEQGYAKLMTGPFIDPKVIELAINCLRQPNPQKFLLEEIKNIHDEFKVLDLVHTEDKEAFIKPLLEKNNCESLSAYLELLGFDEGDAWSQYESYLQDKLQNYCGGIESLADGMKAVFCNEVIPEAKTFDDEAQGTLDRNLIIGSLELFEENSPDLEKRFNWLKEWLQKASTDELKKFLIWVTGGAALAPGDKIYFGESFGDFEVHTCNFGIDVPLNLPIADDVPSNLKEEAEKAIFLDLLQSEIEAAPLFNVM